MRTNFKKPVKKTPLCQVNYLLIYLPYVPALYVCIFLSHILLTLWTKCPDQHLSRTCKLIKVKWKSVVFFLVKSVSLSFCCQRLAAVWTHKFIKEDKITLTANMQTFANTINSNRYRLDLCSPVETPLKIHLYKLYKTLSTTNSSLFGPSCKFAECYTIFLALC